MIENIWRKRPPIMIWRRWWLFYVYLKNLSMDGLMSSLHLKLTIMKQTNRHYGKLPLERIRLFAYQHSGYRKFCERFQNH